MFLFLEVLFEKVFQIEKFANGADILEMHYEAQ